jgi:hypothetical protein
VQRVLINSVRLLAAGSGLIAWTLSAPPAAALDGSIEINQAKASSFPVVISKPGSYRLTSNLDVTAVPSPQNVTVISITASDVTLDLGGFAIIGGVACTASGTPTTVACSVTGSGEGVAGSAGANNVTVRNGTIQGMGRSGVDLPGANILVDAIHTYSEGVAGVLIGSGTVTRCTVKLCKLSGIIASQGSISGNTSSYNGTEGIAIPSGSVTNNVAQSNGNNGIDATGDGIVSLNTLTSNKFGLTLGSNVGYVGNVLYGNTSGTVVGGVQVGQNLCNGSTTCP